MNLNPNGADDCDASHDAGDKSHRGSNLTARLLTASAMPDWQRLG